MIRRIAASVCLLAAMAACAPVTLVVPRVDPSPKATPSVSASAGTPPATAAPSATPPVSVADLSGDWLWGEEDEPPAGPFQQTTCSSKLQILKLEQQGEVLTGALWHCSGFCPTPPEPIETGTNQDGRVRIVTGASPASEIEATYDPETSHLVGTRNGRPFWAAPRVVSGAAKDCVY